MHLKKKAVHGLAWVAVSSLIIRKYSKESYIVASNKVEDIEFVLEDSVLRKVISGS